MQAISESIELDELDPKVCREGRRDHMRRLRDVGWSLGAIAKLYELSNERIREILDPEGHKIKARRLANLRYARRKLKPTDPPSLPQSLGRS